SIPASGVDGREQAPVLEQRPRRADVRRPCLVTRAAVVDQGRLGARNGWPTHRTADFRSYVGSPATVAHCRIEVGRPLVALAELRGDDSSCPDPGKRITRHVILTARIVHEDVLGVSEVVD